MVLEKKVKNKMDKIMNDEVFKRAKEERILLKVLENRCHSWIGHTIRHNKFVVNILEEAISGKKAMEKPLLQYLKQVARNAGADSYTATKRMACNSSRWKGANQ
jgi:porphobilinogen deaminase